MTMSKEWIHLHGIFHLPRKSESVRKIVTVPMVTVECKYGLNGKEYIGTLKRCYVLCRNTICCQKSEERNITIIPMVSINIPITWQEIFMQITPTKNG